MPIGGKPCVRHIIERLIDQSLNDIVLCVNRGTERNFKHEFRDINLTYSVSEEPLGTAGEIFCARHLINASFMIIYGDDLTFLEYLEVLKFHSSKPDATATLVFTDNITLNVGVAELKDDLVVRYVEKPPIYKPAWTGIAIFEPEILKYLKVGLDFSKDVFPKLLAENKRVYAYMIHNPWCDVGSIAHWELANKLIEEEKI